MARKDDSTFLADARLLIDAWQDGHLHRGSCSACMAGHLLAHHAQIPIVLDEKTFDDPRLIWQDPQKKGFMMPEAYDWYSLLQKHRAEPKAGIQLPSRVAGIYTLAELDAFEQAFELMPDSTTEETSWGKNEPALLKQAFLQALPVLGKIHGASTAVIKQVVAEVSLSVVVRPLDLGYSPATEDDF